VELLEYQPQTPLDQGIPLAVAWWQRWQQQHPAAMPEHGAAQHIYQ
jgi:hypothetical protein